jgi:pseudoazurin
MVHGKRLLALAGAILAVFLPVHAETIEVKGAGIKFAPEYIKAKVGDTLAFRNMATHFVEPVEGLWPDGAAKMHSEMGADFDYAVGKEGVYVFKCPPHWGARMGAVLVVGNPPDLAATVDKYIAVAEANAPAKPAKGLLTKFKETLK